MARVSARVIFVCRVVLGETLSVDWRERGTFGKNPFRHFALRNASSPFCRLAATSSPGRGKSFEGKPLVKRSGKPLPAAPIGAATSPEGGGLGREGRFRPHQSTARRSQPIAGKLSALAKASPFRERWHGEAVTERVDSGTNPLSRLRRQLSRRGEPLAEPVSFVHTGQRQEEVSR